VASAETGSVRASSLGTDLNLDLHKMGVSTGGTCQKPSDRQTASTEWPLLSGQCAGRRLGHRPQTFWNLKSRQPLTLPDAGFGPLMNYVGLQTRESAALRVGARSDAGTYPQNLYASMRKKRMGW
jgi:hypothetical protein